LAEMLRKCQFEKIDHLFLTPPFHNLTKLFNPFDGGGVASMEGVWHRSPVFRWLESRQSIFIRSRKWETQITGNSGYTSAA